MLVLLLLVLVVALLVFIFVVPPRWLPTFGLLSTYGLIFFWVDHTLTTSCVSCGNLGSVLASAFLGVLTFVFIVGLGIRFARLLGKPATESSLSPPSLASLSAWAMRAFGLATLLACVIVMILNQIVDSGLIAHLSVLSFGIAWFLFAPKFWQPMIPNSPRWVLHPSVAFRWAGALSCVALLVWSLQVIPKVVEAAQTAAQGAPYCIEAAGANGLRPARSLLDLSGLSMQATRGSTRHAVLTIGESQGQSWTFWSYRRQMFMPESLDNVLRCSPRKNFATDLTWVSI